MVQPDEEDNNFKAPPQSTYTSHPLSATAVHREQKKPNENPFACIQH